MTRSARYVLFLVSAVFQQKCLQPQAASPKFSYPPSMTRQVAMPVSASCLCGKVVYGTGTALPSVLVEIVDGHEQRLESVLSDKAGRFELRARREGVFHLRLSKPNFDTQLVTVTILRRSDNREAVFRLQVSN